MFELNVSHPLIHDNTREEKQERKNQKNKKQNHQKKFLKTKFPRSLVPCALCFTFFYSNDLFQVNYFLLWFTGEKLSGPFQIQLL